MTIDQLQQQLSQQFIQDKTALISLKNLLYRNTTSQHLVCLGDGYHYTWQDLRLHTAYFVQILNNRPTDKQVALVFKSGFLMVCALLALAHCQRKIILPSLQTAEHLADIQPHFSLLLTDNESLSNQVENEGISAVYFHQISAHKPLSLEQIDGLLQANDKINAQAVDLENPDLYLFTSGSTGTPKMIDKYFALFDRQIAIEYDLLAERLQGAVMYSTVNHNHLLGLMYRLFFPLVLRMPFWDYSLIMPEQLSKISLPYALISSPAFLRFLDDKLSYPTARVVYSSGGKLPLAVGEKAKSYLNCPLMEFYGSSETGAIAYKYFPSEDWLALNGIEVQKNANGCLAILSPLLPQNSWYAMEDRVNLTACGFELLGRADRVAKIADKRVSLTQIEHLALQLPEISEVKALVISEAHRDSIGLVVVLSPEFTELSSKAALNLLRNHLRNHIELIALPRRIRLVEFMPLNEQGKLNIKQLEQLFV
ncbi:AMP-binding protein [Gallibacterium trehalosifermentans]|uniref:AMP-binding protein n=1 Tax=Gallibacterium trehalosifermentans TaxID=516935 RepID=A0ABV6H0I4_9PAST